MSWISISNFYQIAFLNFFYIVLKSQINFAILSIFVVFYSNKITLTEKKNEKKMKTNNRKIIGNNKKRKNLACVVNKYSIKSEYYIVWIFLG